MEKVHLKRKKFKNIEKYAKNSDRPFHQRSPIHWEAWFPGGPRIPQNLIFKKHRKNNPKSEKLKKSRNMPKLAKNPLTRGL